MIFRPNPGLARALQGESEYRDAMEAAAEDVKAAAQPFVKRILPKEAEALSVESDEDGVRVVNNDYGGHLAEFGSVNNPPYAPLRRGAQAAGLRLAEEPKE